MRTISPTLAAFVSSCAWNFVVRRTVFFNTGWVSRRSTRHYDGFRIFVANHHTLQNTLWHFFNSPVYFALAVRRVVSAVRKRAMSRRTWRTLAVFSS